MPVKPKVFLSRNISGKYETNFLKLQFKKYGIKKWM